MTDRQRKKSYRWEEANVAKHDLSPVPFAQIESIVRHVWYAEGLSFPPHVKERRRGPLGTGSRTEVTFKAPTKTWIILHELAHAMTSDCSGASNQHGALFMGIYCKLLHKYLGLDLDRLVASAIVAGLRVQPEAIPVFMKD